MKYPLNRAPGSGPIVLLLLAAGAAMPLAAQAPDTAAEPVPLTAE